MKKRLDSKKEIKIKTYKIYLIIKKLIIQIKKNLLGNIQKSYKYY